MRGATELERELAGELAEPPPLGVLFLMHGLNDCVEAARQVLVSLQQKVAKHERRTAYVDDRARFRGMALWVMHLAQDPNAKAVSTLDQGLKWLGVRDGREQDAAGRAAS
ncbi:MAG: hypothetical protein JNK82_40345 [Myxococcaceae bacterium]|nr:hypothetical protein [Myxococcaceae bacterium]